MGIGKCAACQADNAYSRIECHVCGARLPWADAISGAGNTSRGVAVGADEPSFLLAILGFFCWPAGIVVWALQRDQYPRRSSSALKGSVASLVLGVSLFVIAAFLQLYAFNRIAQSRTTFTTISNMPFRVSPPNGFGVSPRGGFSVSPNTTFRVSNPPASTPLPTATPVAVRYTLQQFNKLKIGMTYAQAVKIMGARGDRIGMSYADGTSNVGYLWSNHDDTNNTNGDSSTDCTVTVKHGRIIDKSNHGLR